MYSFSQIEVIYHFKMSKFNNSLKIYNTETLFPQPQQNDSMPKRLDNNTMFWNRTNIHRLV